MFSQDRLCVCVSHNNLVYSDVFAIFVTAIYPSTHYS